MTDEVLLASRQRGGEAHGVIPAQLEGNFPLPHRLSRDAAAGRGVAGGRDVAGGGASGERLGPLASLPPRAWPSGEMSPAGRRWQRQTQGSGSCC